jgi:hypothetical protein
MKQARKCGLFVRIPVKVFMQYQNTFVKESANTCVALCNAIK